MTDLRAHERVLVRHDAAAWLPPGGRADVVLAGTDSPLPGPAGLVRVLPTRGTRVLATERRDGRGLDIPTRRVGDQSVDDCVRGLLADALGAVLPAALLGWVRNVVPERADGYPWPTPEACFVVWHCSVPASLEPDGVWLDPAEARDALGERHWWPLAAHVPQPSV